MIDFKKYLLLLSPHEQIYEIDGFINYITKSKRKKVSIKFRVLKELRFIKKQITLNYFILINSHSNYLFTLTHVLIIRST